MDNNDSNKKQINFDLKPEVAQGTYSNLAIISHSHSEFIIDFATMLPGLPKPEVRSRILMTPEHCKRLLNALADNIARYEASFGPIALDAPEQKGTFNLADFAPNGTKS
ncbi:MAG: DUF3467 domain-containing protein [Bacteroidales bacterium]|nr:DUF3467 domain-containing protein [Bacteroidales bacterium]